MARGGSCCGQSRDVDQTPLVIQHGAAGVRSDGSAGNQASRAPAPPPPAPACTQRQAVRIWPFSLKWIPKEMFLI